MSAAQQRLFVIDQLQEDNTTYNVPVIMKVEHQLDTKKLSQAINQLCARHESLRTNFSVMDGKMVQMVANERRIQIENLKGEATNIETVIGDFVKSFDLTKDPLFRVALYEYEANHSLLMFDFHHIIFDGESMQPFFSELVKLYNDETLPDLRLQYRNFSSWHNKLDISSQKAYWLEALSGELPVTEIPTDFPRPKEKTYTGKSLTTAINFETYQKIQQLALELETTEYVILFTLYLVLLSKYSVNQEVVVGTPVSGRTHPDVQEMIGMFVNTVVIRETFEKTDTFLTAVTKVKQTFLNAYENQDYPLDSLVEDLTIKHDASRNPLFDYTFVYQKGNTEALHLGEAILSDYPLEPSVSKFDLSLTASDTGENYLFNWEFCADLFKSQTIQRFATHYTNLLADVLKNPDQLIQLLTYIDRDDYQQLVVDYNQTSSPLSKSKSIIEAFEKIVAENPDRTALCLAGEKRTYRQLNEKANQLGAELRAQGVGPEDVVALVMDRSIEMILAILGSLKAGAAFLPIAMDTPKSRLAYLISNSQAKLIITDGKNETVKTTLKESIILVLDEKKVVNLSKNLSLVTEPTDLAYIIYTSGSTGNPKGVMIENGNALNLFDWLIPYSEATNQSVVLQKATYTFDASVFEIFWALLAGAQLQLLTAEENKDYHQLLAVMKKNKVTHTVMIPAMFSSLLDFIRLQSYDHELASLTHLYFAGEALTRKLVEQYRELVGPDACSIGNLYGPTETTVCASGYQVGDEFEGDNIPIGTTINNVQAFIMNEGQLCGIGVPGELCISGKGNARGYLNLPEMTQKAFTPSPFSETDTLYHTGDLARWREDGQLDYLGRIDEQVKIRGVRIELREIETKLKELPEVRDAIVLAQTISGELQLCAYLVLAQAIDITQIKEQLKKEVPEYLVPPYLMVIEDIPLTKNGKLAKAELPEPEIQHDQAYSLPRTKTEELIATIFKTVLAIEQISIDDSFFALGGHSIKAMKLASLLQKEFDVSVSLRDVLEYETVAQLAVLMASKEKQKLTAIELAPVDFNEMSSAQKRIFAMMQSSDNHTNYNMPFFLDVEGDLDLPKLTQAINQLIQRHESLRTSFDVVDGRFCQIVNQSLTVSIEQYSSHPAELASLYHSFIRPFDLLNEPLIRVGFVRTTGKSVLMLDVHHIIFDGFSLGVFFDELSQLYDGKTLEPLKRQYKDYSAWHQNLDFSQQKDYWLNELQDMEESIKLPADYKTSSAHPSKGGVVTLTLADTLTSAVNQFAKQQNVTEYMLFLSAFMLILSRYGQQEEVAVGTVVSGRTHQELEQLIGMFVNTVIIKGEMEKSKSFEELLLMIKEKTLQANEHQDYPFEKVVEALSRSNERARNPLFNIMFSSENDSGESMTLGSANLIPLQSEPETVKFDLMFSVNRLNKGYTVMLDYDTALYKKETIEWLGQQFITLLANVMKHPKEPVYKLSVLKEAEIQQLIGENKGNQTDWPKEQSIVQLFEEQVQANPDKVVIGIGKTRLTYEEVNQQANRIAHLLLSMKVKREEFIGFSAEKNSQTIPLMLGILKAGAAYLPLDPKNPRDRQAYMLADSQCRIVLTTEETVANLDASLVMIVEISEGKLNGFSQENPDIPISSQQLAYLMYTSGTTGNPKGTMIEHRNVVRLVKNTHYLEFEKVRIIQTGSIAFDASTFEIWGTLLNNGYLYLVETEVLMDGYLLEKIMKEEKIEVMFMTVTLFNQMVLTQLAIFDDLTCLFVGGEKVSEKHINILTKQNKQIQFINVYGPTESTAFALVYPIKQTIPNDIPIGKPISNTTAYVFDGNRLSGIGIPGELCLGGDGLARGYLNLDELTEEKFIVNPYEPSERLYRTGDLVKLNADHDIEYIGRLDNQVKLRGYRIELDEIKTAFLEIATVKEAEVILTTVNETPILCAYLAWESDLTERQLKENLATVLPSYMIPSVIIKMDKLPVNRNGKVDYQALPDPVLTDLAPHHYTPPETELQGQLVSVFAAVLGLSEFGIDDNFFESGGDSIKAISIVSKLRALGYEVSVIDIMAERTIKLIAEKVKKITASQRISQGSVTGVEVLSPIQQLFFAKQLNQPNHFNQSFIFKSEAIEPDRLRQTLNLLMAHHDSLRTRFTELKQEVLPFKEDGHFLFETHELRYLDEAAALAEIQRISSTAQQVLRIKEGILLNCQLFQTKNHDYLLIIVHHLVIDGVSWRILIEDLNTVYQALTKEVPFILPEKTTSFIDWLHRIKDYTQSEPIRQELPYWQDVATKVKQVTTAEKNGGQTSGEERFGEVALDLSADLTRGLLYETSSAYQTEINDILLTAVSRAIHLSLKQKTVAFSMEGHGRQELIGEPTIIDRTVGWFTSIYPVVFEGIGQSIPTDIQLVKKTLKEIPNKGFGYGLLQTYGERKLDDCQPDTTFNYLGDFESMSDQSNFLQMVKVQHGEDIAADNNFGTPLVINTMIVAGQLHLQLSFNQTYYSKIVAEKLLNALLEQLELVIRHCKQKSQQTLNPSLLPIEDYLQEHYQRHSVYRSFLIDKKTIGLLAIENLTGDLYQSLQADLAQKTFLEQPDYLVDLANYTDTLVLDGEKALEALVRSPKLAVELNQDSCSTDFSRKEIRHRYPATTIQRKYLEQFSETVVCQSITLEGRYTKDQLLASVREIIRTQPSLRSSITADQNEVIREHVFDVNWPINYYNDIYGVAPKEPSIKQRNPKNPLSAIAIVKESEQCHRIEIQASHSIWDKTSLTIFSQLMARYLSQGATASLEERESLRLYANQVNQDKHSLENRQLTDTYHLEKFSCLGEQFVARNQDNPIVQSELVVLTLSEKLNTFYETNTWEFLAYFMKIIAKENGSIDTLQAELPFYILQENRHYLGKNYHESMGAFLDCIPLIIGENHCEVAPEIPKTISQIQHLIPRHSIIDILEESRPLPIDKLFSINNQSVFGLTFDQFQELQQLFTENKIHSYEVLVNKYLNHLVIGVPKTAKNQRKMQQVLEETCNSLEGRLK